MVLNVHTTQDPRDKTGGTFDIDNLDLIFDLYKYKETVKIENSRRILVPMSIL